MTTITAPLTTDVRTRNSSATKDTKLENAYVEVINKEKQSVVKRPGFEFYLQMPIL